MTELDIMKHAKGYLDKLAEGVDPLTGAVVSDTDVVRQARISKCLTYVSGVLEQVIARGGLGALPPVKKQRLPAFSITKEAIERVPISQTPMTITEFGRTINAQIDPERVEKLKTASLLAYLETHGFLEMRPLPSGKSTRQPTQSGAQIGIGLEQRQREEGPYTATVYDAGAQRFLLQHMDEIVEINAAKYNEIVDTGALQGTSWTGEQDARLRDLFQHGTPLPEIARTLQRSTSGVQARLQRLGLIQSQKRSS